MFFLPVWLLEKKKSIRLHCDWQAEDELVTIPKESEMMSVS